MPVFSFILEVSILSIQTCLAEESTSLSTVYIGSLGLFQLLCFFTYAHAFWNFSEQMLNLRVKISPPDLALYGLRCQCRWTDAISSNLLFILIQTKKIILSRIGKVFKSGSAEWKLSQTPLFFKVENNSLELTRIIQNIFIDPIVSARKKAEKRGRHEQREKERKRRFGVNAIISLIEAGLCACI